MTAPRSTPGANPGARDLELLHGTDIYLIDQLLRGRIAPGARVFDAGCGGGRNLRWFLAHGHPIVAVDMDSAAVEGALMRSAGWAPEGAPTPEFRVARLEDCGSAYQADIVLCNAVLHFARDPEHFAAMLSGAWRVLAPGGLFFARLASSIGIEDRVQPLGDQRFKLPDGSQRFLVDEAELLRWTEELGGELLDPLKTTNVQGLRAMTTWVMRRRL